MKFTRSSLMARAMATASLYPGLILEVMRLPRDAFVVCTTDPPLAWAFCCLLGRRVILWSQDVYPAIASAVGVLRTGGLMARSLELLASAGMARVRAVAAIGGCMGARLLDDGCPADKLHIVPNWAPAFPRFTDEELRDQRTRLGWGDRFVVLYSGNFGMAHCFDFLPELIRRLPGILFVFAGSGPRRSDVLVALKGFSNVRCEEPFSQEAYPRVLQAANIHLVTLRDEALGLVVPSKIYDALAAARPILFAGPQESDVAKLVIEARCGAAVCSDDVPAMEAFLASCAADPSLCRELGNRAWSAARTVESAADEFEALLGTICPSSKASRESS